MACCILIRADRLLRAAPVDVYVLCTNEVARQLLACSIKWHAHLDLPKYVMATAGLPFVWFCKCICLCSTRWCASCWRA